MRRRTVVNGIAAIGAGVVLGRKSLAAAQSEVFTPEAFGARGDGFTNDSAAFRKMSNAVNRAGGGRIVLRRTVYLVGEQRPGFPQERYAFAPGAILQFTACTRDLIIEGNGATLRCAPGMRYGTFDRLTGRSVELPMPNTTPGLLATPYEYMVYVELCRGAVTIADLELDGAVDTLRIGGPWGDVGRQIACVGLYLRDNVGDEIIRNLYTHHHAQDGLMIAGTAALESGASKVFSRVRSNANGRQGCSFIGGHGYTFSDCTFSRTGRGPLYSPPGAGFDIEAESMTIRRLRFDRCAFIDNAGCGMVADSGDSAEIVFFGCRFVGTDNWSIWSAKPSMRYERCEIVGSAVQFFGSPDPRLATQIFDCVFTDASARSTGGKVFRNGPIANVSDSKNVLFARCRFDALEGAQLPWSTGAIYEDCTLRQAGVVQGYPRGRFRGSNFISGNVDIYNSQVSGKLVINGKVIPASATS
jgi:hypothetical protein